MLIFGFISTLFIVLIFTHFFIYKSIVFFLNFTNPTILWSIRIALITLVLCFVASMMIASRYDNIFTEIFYTFSAGWLTFLNYLFWSSLVLWIIFSISKFLQFSLDFKIVSTIVFSLGILTGIYGLINAQIIRITPITVKIQNLPDSWLNKKAVWISDVHLGQVHKEGFAQTITEKINALKPEIVFIGGDLYDGVKTDLDKVTLPLNELKAPQGIYFITGNHEEFSDVSQYINAVKNIGIKVLDNERVLIDGVEIIGVDYNDSQNKTKFAETLTSLKLKNTPTILLKHAPTSLDIAAKAGVDLTISGHTHKAQMFPLNFFTYLIYKGFDYGLNDYGKMQVYTSSGTGTWGPPARVGSISEIVEFTFTK